MSKAMAKKKQTRKVKPSPFQFKVGDRVGALIYPDGPRNMGVPEGTILAQVLRPDNQVLCYVVQHDRERWSSWHENTTNIEFWCEQYLRAL